MPAEPDELREVGPVAGVLLAAGSSARMGGPNKLLLKIDGETVLRRAAGRAVGAGLAPVIVVVGHESERSRDALRDLDVSIVVNPEHALGINRSLRTGIAALGANVRAAVVLLADMPFVSEEMLRGLVIRYRETGAPIVVSQYGEVQAPPTLYDRCLFADLGAESGEGSGKKVYREHRARAAIVEWPAVGLTDIDRPEDWERIRAAAAGAAGGR